MRRLLNTLFVLTENAYLSLDGENVVVQVEGEEKGRFPLHALDGILCFSYAGASPALMGACVERDVELSFMRPGGRFLARACGRTRGNVLLRKTQYRVSEDAGASLAIGRNMLIGKVYNARWVLERATRDHALSVDVERLKRASGALKGALARLEDADGADRLRGIEGDAAADYFGAFNELILSGDEAFVFHGRSRRPPLDPVNAMLSFAYAILASNCASALEAVGLDPYVGFVHTDRPGRESLALDLMEELRPVLADRVVLSCINSRIVNAQMFEKSASGAVMLDEDGRRAFLKAWQDRKKETLTHPFLREKIPWGLVPYVQALLLARYLRGDLDAYPPFLWK
ncbi:MAG: type I-C CRISPR-associated endonuclease Cas1 [Oscillospiraceae bacterium]|nr:type I-C CRISPR-associated endonuclease Cas1 [Oscillospiraceae bacterium]